MQKKDRNIMIYFAAVSVAMVLGVLVLLVRPKMEHWSQGPSAYEPLEIIAAFERVLDRRPTDDELTRARQRLHEDPAFSLQVLELQLNSLPERQRLVATQTNALATELEGVFTREQIKRHVRDVYQDIVGKPPDKATETLLTDKFVKAGLDQHELMNLIKSVSIIPLANNPPIG